MNRWELITALKYETGLTKSKSEAVVNIFFDEMTEALAKSGRIEIRGLFSFYVKKYKGYTGRNPKTGEVIKVKPKKLPFFKCSPELRERVDK